MNDTSKRKRVPGSTRQRKKPVAAKKPAVVKAKRKTPAAKQAAAVKGPVRRPNPLYSERDVDLDVDMDVLRNFDTADLPLWKESFMGMDWLRLRSSRVYYGCGVPRGNKAAVILVPGFLASDVYLAEMNLWFRRIGYRPYMSRIGRNADCPNILVQHLVKTMQRAYRDTGRPVHLVGHSMGGVLSRIAAAYHPELTASVFMLGSPIRGVRVHPWVLAMQDVVHTKIHFGKNFKPLHLAPEHPACFTDACACGFACTWRGTFPHDIPQCAIYTRADGVLDWRICKTDRPEVDVEVSGTHCGLVWNPEVYNIVAERMAGFEAAAALKQKAARKKAS
jgi:triacylglycerol lipase